MTRIVHGPDRPQFHDYAPWLNALCGFLVFLLRYLSPRPTFDVHWNLFLTGLVIMFAAVAAEIAHGNASRNYWSAINAVAGVWLIVSTQTIPSIFLVTLGQDSLGVLVIILAIATSLMESAFQRRVAKGSARGVPGDRYGARTRSSN